MSKMMKSHVIGGFALAALGAAGLAVQVARAERPVSEGVVPPLPITHPSRGIASPELPVPSVPSVLGLEDMVHDSVISRVITTAAVAEAAGAAPSSPVVAPSVPGDFKVEMSEIDDLKSVYATVRSTDRVEARARIGGTISSLNIDEGSEVKTGQVLATVVDQKLALKLKALAAQIEGLKAQVENAKRELGRQEELIKRGFTPKAKVDELRTQLEVAENQLKSAEAESDVVNRQVQEGEVLAPASGRALLVPVTVGSVVLPGESLATIAANQYVLRLELPERHARFIKKGDPIQLGPRTVTSANSLIKGAITQVYPELQSGHVIADASVTGLGNYFVGERVLVYISGGKRQGMVIPHEFVTTRYGYDFVKVRRDGGATDVVVQLGPAAELGDGKAGIEVLGGLNPGDEIVQP